MEKKIFGNGELKEAHRRVPIVYLRFHKLHTCISIPLIRVELSDLSFGFIEARWISHGRSGRALTRTRLSRENPLTLASARNLNESFVGEVSETVPIKTIQFSSPFLFDIKYLITPLENHSIWTIAKWRRKVHFLSSVTCSTFYRPFNDRLYFLLISWRVTNVSFEYVAR